MTQSVPMKIAYYVTCMAFVSSAAAETLQSSFYPVQVHYEDPDHADVAQTILDAAEEAWEFQVEEIGFLQPPGDEGQNGSDDYDIFIDATAYIGYVVVDFQSSERPFGYCTHMVVDPDIPGPIYPLLVAHEFHHAIQFGVRPMGNNIAEAGAVYLAGIQRPGEAQYLSYFLGINEFQAFPERSLDWQGSLGDFYPYGGALYLAFLEQEYGNGALGTFVVQIYNLMSQAEYPHYFDALRELIDFDAAYDMFSRWRYFVGPKDDGEHFEDLSIWEGSPEDEKLNSVALMSELTLQELPVSDVEADPAPMPYGASYVRLSLEGFAQDTEIRLEFAGDSQVNWIVQTIMTGADITAAENSLVPDNEGKLEATIPVETYDTLVLGFVNMGDGDYSPDGEEWDGAAFTYSLLTVEPTPPDDGKSAGNSGCACATALGAPELNGGSRTTYSLLNLVADLMIFRSL